MSGKCPHCGKSHDQIDVFASQEGTECWFSTLEGKPEYLLSSTAGPLFAKRRTNTRKPKAKRP